MIFSSLLPLFLLFLSFFPLFVFSDSPLSIGQSVNLFLTAQLPVYYYLDLPPVQNRTADLTISVTSLGSGDPDLFLDFNVTHPDYDPPWQSSNDGNDAITISRDYLREAYNDANRLYMMIVSASAGRCTLVAFYDRPITLSLDQPQSAPLVVGQTRNFIVTVPIRVPSITISVSSSAASANVALFVNPDFEASDYRGDSYWQNDAQGGSVTIDRVQDAGDWPINNC
jgi:hypothetical protein